MLLLGIDVGTSSIKVSVVDAATSRCVASAQYPEIETGIIARQPGWAEQEPAMWWSHVQQAILLANKSGKYDPKEIGAIGIAYQMHGLVCIDEQQQVLRDSIIWCDSRAVSYGDKAFAAIGEEKSLSHLLNSPGNFTASKLAWVKENEPHIYEKIDKIMLPGDYISMQLTSEINTTISSLSEGIFWDFKSNELSEDVMEYYGFDKALIPSISPAFSSYGNLKNSVADELSLSPGIPVTYKAGDQPNNALSLNVMEPGEVAATAGTSGVIYGVSDKLAYDQQSRINSFAHVNYKALGKETGTAVDIRIGILLCINGTGILNRWMKQIAGNVSYHQMNEMAGEIAVGSEGLLMLPFGNGAERMLNNKVLNAHIHNIDLNKHSNAHLFRSAQEGIACAFRFGLDIMRENQLFPKVIRAGNANMFLSPVFMDAFVNVTNTPVELYDADGSVGAAIGAGIGVGYYKNAAEAFANTVAKKTIEPTNAAAYDDLYFKWKECLEKELTKIK